MHVPIVPAGAHGGALDACGLAAIKIRVVSVRLRAHIVRCRCLYLQN